MKKLLKLIIALCLMSTVFYSCKDDNDDSVTETNHLTLGDSTYDLTYGLIENYGHYYVDDAYNTDLYLTSSEEYTYYGDSIEAMAAELYFELESTTNTALDEGSYTYDNDATYASGTYDSGYLDLDYTYNINTDEESYNSYYIIGGGITVSKEDSIYTIKIDCSTYSGETITGYYKGTLDYFDWAGYYGTSSVATMKSAKAKKLRFKKNEE